MAASAALVPSGPMRVGIIGVGKLGLPVAVCMERHGHSILAFDVNPAVRPGVRPETLFFTKEAGPGNEGDLRDTAAKCERLNFASSVEEVCASSQIVFVSVQTPHDPLYEGTTRVPKTRADFNYDYLCSAMQAVSKSAAALGRSLPVVIISTVLPGTVRERILPLLHANVKLAYNPFFIAMGTVWNDFVHPEFILLGRHDEDTGALVRSFYKTITPAPVFETTIENAELIKVSCDHAFSLSLSTTTTTNFLHVRA